jgi:hypothetical protein
VHNRAEREQCQRFPACTIDADCGGAVCRLPSPLCRLSITVITHWVLSGEAYDRASLGKVDRTPEGWLHRSIDQALALNRTEVRPDGLCPEDLSLHLAISWRARNLHPWDHDLVGDRKALRLVEQTFSDTEVALESAMLCGKAQDLLGAVSDGCVGLLEQLFGYRF